MNICAAAAAAGKSHATMSSRRNMFCFSLPLLCNRERIMRYGLWIKTTTETEKGAHRAQHRAPRIFRRLRDTTLIGHIILVEHSMDTVFARARPRVHTQSRFCAISIYIFYARRPTFFCFLPVDRHIYLLAGSSFQSSIFLFIMQ